MSKKTLPIPPLNALQKFSSNYPNVFQHIDKLILACRSGEIEKTWDIEQCYCPISVAIGALSVEMSKFEAAGIGGYVAALAAWRQCKLIYQFDSTLLDELISTADDMVIPVEILQHLPAPCIFVSFPDTEQSVGFFAFIENDVDSGQKELRIYYLSKNNAVSTVCIVHLLPDGTINAGIDSAIKQMRRQNNISSPLNNFAINSIENTRRLTVQAVQLILYICAENADIKENEAQAKIYRKSARIVDRMREVRQWDVGENIGAVIRRQKQVKKPTEELQNEENDVVGETKEIKGRQYKNRPHVRRAHWHHFWVGSGANKRLIIRWLNAFVINASDGDTPPTIIIKEDKK